MRRKVAPIPGLTALRLSAVFGALAVLGIPAVLGVAGASTQSSPAARLRANEAAARRDVVQHLRSLRLPSDVTSISTEPRFARSFTSDAGPGSRYDAHDMAMWSTAASPETIIAYVRAHAPAEATADPGTGSGGDSRTGVSSLDVQFSWPDVGQELLNRTLTVTVVTPAHGRSVILAQTESSWFVPRSASELVPRGVRAVLITLRLGPSGTGPVVQPSGHVQTSTYLVWRSARVHALVDEFNALPIVQPGAEPIACPLILTGSEASGLTLAFKTGRNGTTLARAEVSAHRGQGWDDGAGPCDPIDFWIGARQQTSLMSTTFVKDVGKLIGANIS